MITTHQFHVSYNKWLFILVNFVFCCQCMKWKGNHKAFIRIRTEYRNPGSLNISNFKISLVFDVAHVRGSHGRYLIVIEFFFLIHFVSFYWCRFIWSKLVTKCLTIILQSCIKRRVKRFIRLIFFVWTSNRLFTFYFNGKL